MTSQVLSRATDGAHLEGRTLTGVAYRYGHPSLVSDGPGTPKYLEQFDEGCDTKTLHDRAADGWPLGWLHPWSASNRNGSADLEQLERARRPIQPLGAVRFRSSKAEGALLFEAGVSRTRLGDEALELYHDGAARDVSVQYRPMRSTHARAQGRLLVHRTVIAIRELSLAPTGLGQHDGAKVLALRAHVDDLDDGGEVVTIERPRYAETLRRRRLLDL